MLDGESFNERVQKSTARPRFTHAAKEWFEDQPCQRVLEDVGLLKTVFVQISSSAYEK